ncbi:MAG: isoprenylcysteine carboxylmethyltransferase family protein [Candidatus Sulfotelmatobacter sp.]|jgi:protein-S-isoprenylcysteine O-methyltransferase Ste14
MEGRHIYVFTGLQLAAAGALFWGLVTWTSPWNLQRYVGTVLVVVGITFIGIARFQLGKSFSIKAEAHKLVTTGLYSKIRNPIYVFGMMMITGLILVLQKPVLWLFLVAAVVGQTIRARREARVLDAAFGDAYREYRRKTWF